MRRIQFSLQQVMIATAACAAIFAFLPFWTHFLIRVVPVGLGTGLLVSGIVGLSRLPLRARIAVEIATLVTLIALSAVIWRPGFYTWEERRCEELSRAALEATAASPEAR